MNRSWVEPTIEHWRALWSTLIDGPDVANVADRVDTGKRLLNNYQQTHRHYHSLQHLGECLTLFAKVRHHAQHPEEVELALWFHDAIYDIHSNDNENKSAAWARVELLTAGLPMTRADRVHELVMMTRHDALPLKPDAQLLVDVDLAILGAATQRFDEYEKQVRREYAHVMDAEFRRGRTRILQSFLDRPTIYSTEYLREELEAQARSNLLRSLRSLQG